MVQIFSFLRALIIPLVIVPVTIVLSILVILVLFIGLPKFVADFIVRVIWCHTILAVSGVKVIVEGKENVPDKQGFLFLFSHSSHYDIPILFAYSPRTFCFGAKIELFSIPFFGRAMTAFGTLPIARDDRGKVIEVYRNAEKRVAAGEAFALAPEGTRRSTPELAPFKSGPFIFAINAKMPIVPVVIHGADQVLPKKSFLINAKRWQQKVYIKFLPQVSVEGYTTSTAKSLREKVRQQMFAAHEDLKSRFNN